MTQRFNAPPGWPQPEADWSPPPGWQPDPSWPAAPEGWSFWVDDTTAIGQNAQAGPARFRTPGANGPDGSAAASSPYLAGAPSGGTSAQARMAAARKSMLFGGGIAVVGAVITLLGYLNPGNDGRFSVWWGLIIVGLFSFVRGLIAYSSAKKAAAFTPGGSFDGTSYAVGNYPGAPGNYPGASGNYPGASGNAPGGSYPGAPGGSYPGAPGGSTDDPNALRPGEYRP